MEKIAKYFEKIIISVLILMMMAIIVLSTIAFVIVLVGDMLRSPNILPQINDLLEIFGFFLLILIGVELLETIRSYLSEHVVHVEVVIEVALIAIARKVIIIDLKEISANSLLGIAAIITALAAAYYLMMARHRQKGKGLSKSLEALEAAKPANERQDQPGS
ncbi:MAG TPA: phosphate-starvation-inducible PsiE family protein [Saprospiraceae bacterium]|nr:phosphate-starvation-inducible PsiE family protein [Saprospiraceae bacterium]